VNVRVRRFDQPAN